jgi:threonine dehydrogenase-like Zn-dependent dehydrogenase
MTQIPDKQRAVQLVGPDQLILNSSKEMHQPGPFQILARIEAVGLCFSDLKLLKQFSAHARKTRIKSGIDPAILDEIPSYVPDEKPTVPGHEAVVRIVAVGSRVNSVRTGQRFLVQTDYRWLPTANSNGSFGYNFEGALQEYVLMDERVITSPKGESMLIPASEKLSAASIALVEPWACVEDSYAARDRRELKAGGAMLIAADLPLSGEVLSQFFKKFGRPARITYLGESRPPMLDIPIVKANAISETADAAFDDILYFGSDAQVAEKLFWKAGPRGLVNIIQCGRKFGRPVVTTVGRVHYGGIRIIGTTGNDPAESMNTIPSSGEIRPGNRINVIGAGGPMGVMHVIRNICQGVKDVSVYAGDLDDNRLASLGRVAESLAKANGVSYHPYNPGKTKPAEAFDYVALMAPVPALAAQAVKDSAPGGVINIFAGIPATVTGEIDLDTYIARRLYFIGTSGSVLEDMKLVLAKVEAGRLDTNLSVAAVCGLDGAVEGIRAVEKALIPGKILVYPQCRSLGLTKLEDLAAAFPAVAGKLNNGFWTADAERELLSLF